MQRLKALLVFISLARAAQAGGYTWAAQLQVPGPGTYRVTLSEAAALDPYPESLRLLQGGTELPYVWAQGSEERWVDLAREESFDPKRNESTYSVKFPQASPRWKALRVSADGAFQRAVRLERPRSAIGGFEAWQQTLWIQGPGPAQPLILGLAGLQPQAEELHLVLMHGSKPRFFLGRLQAGYDAPSMLFVAAQAGTLRLLGGNPGIGAPDYGLRPDTLPGLAGAQTLSLGPSLPYTEGWLPSLTAPQLGFYLLLGLLALGLAILVIRSLRGAKP